ncbi:MAG: flagellar biosynthetic protein FliR [Salaquimonas sp.]|nr:flagellar biosynthetic protein FliR [Salaquimonas sp.]
MNLPGDEVLLALFLVFARVGTCLMLLPGFAAAQILQRLRLFIAFAITLAVFPLVEPQINTAGITTEPAGLFLKIAAEMATGAAFALPIRFLFGALSFMGESIMQMIGLNPIPGIMMEEGQADTTLSAFFNTSAIVLFFALGLHANAILAIASSYQLVPLGEFADFTGIMVRLRDGISDAFVTVLRLMAPFLIYALAINFVSGIVNKLTPNIPVYFVATPFLIAGGAILLYWIGDDILALFVTVLSQVIGF